MVPLLVQRPEMSVGKNHNWKSYSVIPESGSPTSHGSISDVLFCHPQSTPFSLRYYFHLSFENGLCFSACFLASIFFMHVRYLYCSVVYSTTFQEVDFRSSALARVCLRAGRTVLHDFSTECTLMYSRVKYCAGRK